MKTVILTGGMGSGKSAVAALLKARGVPVYDSDSRTKSLYDRDPALVGRLEAALRRIRQQRFDPARVDAVLRNDASLDALSAETDRVFLNLFVSL